MAQINYTYTKASIACASLTDEAIFIPEFQHTAACAEHQREDPTVVNVHEKLPPGENSFFSQSQKEDQRQQVTCALCSGETGRKEWGAHSVCPALRVLNRRSASRGRVLLEHVGISSQQYPIHEPQTQALPHLR